MTKLNRWWKTYVKSIRKDLVVMLLADIVFLLVMELFLRNIPAPFPVFVRIGDLLVTLAVSFLASFIFYFVQVHLPETQQKTNIYPSLAFWFNRIVIYKEYAKNWNQRRLCVILHLFLSFQRCRLRIN